jgi:predicted GNAT family N-acyltransferase
MPASFHRYPVGSPRFESAWHLRQRVLLDPFGIDHDLARSDDIAALHMGLFHGDECVACLMLVPRSLGTVQMRQVAVTPELRRQGMGRILTTQAEHIAQELGHERLIAHARDSALPFYLALGYVAVGGWFEEVGIPHQKVEKDLPKPTDSLQPAASSPPTSSSHER